MGFSLVQGDERYVIGFRQWVCALALAMESGWIPEGTVFNIDRRREELIQDLSLLEANIMVTAESEDWPGFYTTNDWQLVSKRDAMSLAQALAKSIQLMPPPGTPSPMTSVICQPMGHDLEFGMFPGDRSEVSIYEVFVGDNGLVIQDIIAVCMRGGFEIW